MRKRYPIKKEWLEQKLKEKSKKDIALELGCSYECIKRKVRKFGIKVSKHSHLINEDYFKTWSYNMAYILGFSFADGTINTKLHHNKLAFELNRADKEILEFIVSEIQPTRNIHEYEKVDKRTGKVCLTCMTDFSSRNLVDSLISLGCVPNKTYDEMIIPDIPDEYVGDFVRGYFDGDGTIGRYEYIDKRNGNIRYKTAGTIYCHQLKPLIKIQRFINCGIIDEKSNPNRLNFCSKKDINKLYKIMYINHNRYRLNRKYKLYTRIINEF